MNTETRSAKSQPKRPIAITIVCIIGFIGVLFSIPLMISNVAASIGLWFQIHLGLSVIIGLICFIGMWRMKKIAVYAYAVFVILNQLILLSSGNWNLAGILIPALVVGITLYYVKAMR